MSDSATDDAPTAARNAVAIPGMLEDVWTALEAAGLGFWSLDMRTDALVRSPLVDRIFGFAEGEAGPSADALRRRIHPDHTAASKRLRNELIHGRDTVDEERRIILPDGSTRWIAVRGRVLRAADGEPLRTVGVIEDVTARKDEEAAFRRSASRMEAALRAGRLGSWNLDLLTGRVDCSPACKANFGLPSDAPFTYGTILRALHPDDRPRLEREMRDAIENRTGYDAEYRVLWPDGSEHWLIVRGHALYRNDGTPGGMTGVTLDITERRSAEEESRKERDRVELLFREFNHRVKNNLQMIASLLSLQASQQGDPALRRALDQTRQRIVTVAQTHDSLSLMDSSGAVSVAGYFESLRDQLMASVEDSGRITLEIEAEDVVLPSDKAIPLGLIVNELVTNAIKYAYPPPAEGSVSVRFGAEPDAFRLVVADHGCGLPVAFEDMQGGLGLRLVRGLVAQVNGTLTAEEMPGLRLTIRFPRTA